MEIAPTIYDIAQKVKSLREGLSECLPPEDVANSLAAVFGRWRNRDFDGRRNTIALISERLGFEVALLDESLDALLLPFTREALVDMARRVVIKPEVLGFVMAGNVAGAGLHEIVLALIAGRGLMIKTASREPFFFREFIRTLMQESPALGGRACVLSWEREREDLSEAMRRATDLIVAYGSDNTISALGAKGAIMGFGSKVSGAVVLGSVLKEPAERIARDVTLFEQLGCLSPHHVFVRCDDDADAMRFAESLADAMQKLAMRLPPPKHLELEDAAALRSFRETARWRSIAGEPVRVFEGQDLDWAVVFDRDAPFSVSPGLRCVYVSPVRDAADLQERIAVVQGRIEAVALVGDDSKTDAMRRTLADAGVSYLVAPGAMQSPPLTWRHGGGMFLDRMTSTP